jgi:hypothetical protein
MDTQETSRQQQAWAAAERGRGLAAQAAERTRQRERAMQAFAHRLRHHPEAFTPPTVPPVCHLHR